MIMKWGMAEVIVDDEKVIPSECSLAVGWSAIKPFATCHDARDESRVAGCVNIGEETLKIVANTGEVIVNGLRVNMVGHENSEKT